MNDNANDTTYDKEIKKAPRFRSPAYPSFSISHCVGFTQKIHQSFGSTAYQTREDIASVLNISDSHVQSQLSSSVQYGFLDMKPKIGYKPTSLFFKIYKPMDDEEKRAGLIECLCRPNIYTKLVNQFQGTIVPQIPGLATILFRQYGLSESASEFAAKVFIENLRSLNLLDAENNLSLNKSNQNIFEQDTDNEYIEVGQNLENQNEILQKNALPSSFPVPTTSTNNKPIEVITEPPNVLTYPVQLKDNRMAKLIIPEGYSDKDLNRLIRFIEGMKIGEDE